MSTRLRIRAKKSGDSRTRALYPEIPRGIACSICSRRGRINPDRQECAIICLTQGMCQDATMNLDLALLIASITLTILLAGVGVEMANNPPSSCKSKWTYRSIFIILGTFLIGVTIWQGKRNMKEQQRTVSEGRAAQKQVKAQYDQVQGKLDTIVEFIAHPPPNLSSKQIATAVQGMACSPLGSGWDPYKNWTNKCIAEAGVGFVNQWQDEIKKAFWNGGIFPEQTRLGIKFRACCLEDAKNLRSALRNRLGPGYDNLALNAMAKSDQGQTPALYFMEAKFLVEEIDKLSAALLKRH
jgi:hypothetical protein